MLESIKIDEKYAVFIEDDCKEFYAKRYGEDWRDLSGDKLVLAMARKIQELEKELRGDKKVD